jgi:hypothetical protein
LNWGFRDRHGDQILVAENGDRVRQIASLFGLLRHPIIYEFLRALLNFAQVDATTAIEISRCPEQTVPDSLGGQSPAAWIVPALLVRECGCDLNRILLKRTEAGDVVEQAPSFEVRGLATVLRPARIAFREEFCRKFSAPERPRFSGNNPA